MKLKGKVAIVTGAARGIGRCIAARFAAEGASVIIADVDREQAQRTVAELAASGAAVWTIPVDVAEPAQVKALVQKVESEFGRFGVRLAIENHDRFKSATLLAILERLDSAWAGICLDTANSFGCSEGPEAALETLGPRVFNLHLKDYVVRRMDHLKGFLIEGRPAGQGDLDIPHILQRLGELGRDPYAILELWPAPEASMTESIAKEEAWAAQSVRYLRRFISD